MLLVQQGYLAYEFHMVQRLQVQWTGIFGQLQAEYLFVLMEALLVEKWVDKLAAMKAEMTDDKSAVMKAVLMESTRVAKTVA